MSEGNSIIRLSSIVLGEIPTLLSSHHSKRGWGVDRREKRGERGTMDVRFGEVALGEACTPLLAGRKMGGPIRGGGSRRFAFGVLRGSGRDK